MKKTVFYSGMLLLAALMMVGCDKVENEPENAKKNYLEYANKSRSITEAGQIFYGHYYSTNSNNITLVFATEEHYVAFEMFVPNGDTKLLEGVYQPSSNYQAFAVTGGGVFDYDDNEVYSVKTVVITVKLEGNVYTIDIEGKLDNNTNLKGNYTGQLKWFDESEDEVGNYYTITEGSNVQTIAITSPQQMGNANGFIVSFTNSFMVNFRPSGTATTLPAGSYPNTNATPMPIGSSHVSMNISGVSGTVNSTSGSFNVQKSGSNYTVTFNFTTNTTPVRTVTGSYSGTIPLL